MDTNSLPMQFAPADDRIDHPRRLLTLLARSEADPLERLVAVCALAHLESHDPPRHPLPDLGPATPVVDLSAARRQVFDALVDIIRTHELADERACAALAVQEFTTPLHPVDGAGTFATSHGADR